MNITDYYLDIDKILKLENEFDRRKIHEYYTDMLAFQYDGRSNMVISLFNTLLNNGYLLSIRNEKINSILSNEV